MVFNVGTGQQTSIKQLALLLIDALGVDLEPTFRPREVLVSQREASIDLIGEHLGWKPEVGIEEGLGHGGRLGQEHAARRLAALTVSR